MLSPILKNEAPVGYCCTVSYLYNGHNMFQVSFRRKKKECVFLEDTCNLIVALNY